MSHLPSARRARGTALAALTLLTALTALGAAGCSKKASEPAASSSDSAAAAPAAPAPSPAPAAPLRIGVTLHPYYSWTSAVIAGLPGFEVLSILPGEVDAGSYQPAPADIAKLTTLDAIVINGIGHDDFIRDMIAAAGRSPDEAGAKAGAAPLALIEANTGTPLLPSAHGEGGNSHTFISLGNAIAQSRLIAAGLGALRPAAAEQLLANASAYAARLRALESAAAAKLAAAEIKRVVTVHDGYSYLLQELGIELAGVVEPAHGLVPSAAELGEMIALMKREKITVVLTEETFPDKLLATLRDATGAKVYVLSHVATGAYTPKKFEDEMAKNLDILVQALVTDPK